MTEYNVKIGEVDMIAEVTYYGEDRPATRWLPGEVCEMTIEGLYIVQYDEKGMKEIFRKDLSELLEIDRVEEIVMDDIERQIREESCDYLV